MHWLVCPGVQPTFSAMHWLDKGEGQYNIQCIAHSNIILHMSGKKASYMATMLLQHYIKHVWCNAYRSDKGWGRCQHRPTVWTPHPTTPATSA